MAVDQIVAVPLRTLASEELALLVLWQTVNALDAERRQLRAELERRAAMEADRVREVQRMRESLTTISARSKQFCEELVARQREIQTLRDENASLVANEACLLAAAEKLEVQQARGAERAGIECGEPGDRLAALEPETLSVRGEICCETNVRAGAAAGSQPPQEWEELPVRDSEPEAIAVVDGGPVGRDVAHSLAQRAEPAVAIAADPYSGFELQARPRLLSVNLAVPGAWGGIRRLCLSHGFTDEPVVAYALAHDDACGAWLGEVDFALLPGEDCRLSELLRRRAPKSRRAMLLAQDPELVRQLRAHLDEARVSVSVVLDSRQALEMMPIVRPETVIVHLSPSCPDAFRFIADLRRQTSAEVPIVFVLDAAAQPEDAAFLRAGTLDLAERGRVSAGELTGACLTTLGVQLERRPEARSKTDHLHSKMQAPPAPRTLAAA